MTVATFADHLAGQAPASDRDDTTTIADILHDIRAFIHRYVHLSDHEATLIAVWVAMTHMVDAFEFVAYIHVTSPVAECGKTRLLEVLEPLVAHPWFTARVSAAVLMRKVDKEHPTLLLDESDSVFKGGDEQYSESLRGMLNAGFHRSGKASVCVGQGANLQYRDFSVFGPKAIAGIGRLPATVESRSIPIVMKRRTKDEIVHKWRHRRGHEQGDELRARLVTLLCPHVDRLREAEPMIPEGLSDRAEDVLEPLFAVADLAGGEWPQAVRTSAIALIGLAARGGREADQNLGLELLADIQQVFDMYPTKDALASKTILDRLAAMEDRPWATFGKSEKPITGHRVARLLKGFEIEPAGTIRDGDATYKGYRRAVFEDAFARYLGSKASQGNNSNENGPESRKTEASQADLVTLSEMPKTPDKHWASDAVTLSTPDHEPANDDDGSF